MDLTARFSNPIEPNPLAKNRRPDADPDTEAAGSSGRVAKQVQRRLTSDEVGALVRRYQAGESAQELARAFKVHRTTVTGHLQRNGVQLRGARVLKAADVPLVVQLYEAGHSLAKLGHQFDVHPKAVASELRDAGVEIRTRPGWSR